MRGLVIAFALASSLLPVGATRATARLPADAGARRHATALATPEQIQAEKVAVDLLSDPQVRAIQAEVEAELAKTARGRSAEGAAGLHNAIIQWTASLLLREEAGDPARPAILWSSDNAPHSWYGIHVPGRGASGDNPDNIYRVSFLDGAGRYEIAGQLDPAHRPSQLSVEINRGTAGDLAMKAGNRGKSDFGNQIAMLTDRTLAIAPDGSFRITIGGEGAGPNHVRTPVGPVSLLVRESLSDWTQLPSQLSIHRLDTVQEAPFDKASLRAKVLADLPGYLRFWGTFPDIWYAGLPQNRLVGPLSRDGGWGYLAFAPVKLRPDEAFVIRTTRGSAQYTGSQFSDQWTISPDPRKFFTSINTSQAVPDADGGFTYVIAARDPGVANWLDTTGLSEGFLLLRWQGFPPGADGTGLVREARVVKLGDLNALPDVARVAPRERRAALEKRGREYRTRLGE